MESPSTIECLLLAQAVYEHGADAWETVSSVLSAHPALAQCKCFSTPQSCRQIYLGLMNQASLDCSEANNAPHAPLNLALAQRHYKARLLHLRDLIAAEEARFKSIVAEIDEIRSGAWNDKIKAQLAVNDHADETQALSQEPRQSPTRDPHVLDDATVPVAEAPAPAAADAQVVEAAPEEPAAVETSEESKPQPELSRMDVEEPPLSQEPEPQQREGKRKVSDSDSIEQGLREKKRPRDESTPEADEQPSSRQRDPVPHRQTPPPVPNKRFQAVIGMLHSQISQHRNGNIFHNPIKHSEAPDYREIIKRPMDLKTIKGKIKDGVISNSLEFQRDVYLMFANAMMYNRPSSDIYHMAEEMMAESETHINTFRQTEGFIRSTRA